MDVDGPAEITVPGNSSALVVKQSGVSAEYITLYAASGGGGQLYVKDGAGNSKIQLLGSDGSANFDGTVGIGDSSPANTLSVSGPSTTGNGSAGNVAEFSGPNNSNGFQVFVSDANNNCGIQTKSAGPLIINPYGGNVGIGTASPASSTGYNTLTLGNGTSTGGQIKLENAAGNNFFIWHDSSGVNIYNQSATTQRFYTSGTERLRIHSGGTVSIPTGIELGSGLDGTSANTLDDYEEGTWTPGAGSNFNTFTNAEGYYTKIGRLVHLVFQFFYASTSSTTATSKVTGLPFPVANLNQGTGIEATGLIFNSISGTARVYLMHPEGGQSQISIDTRSPLTGSTSTGSGFMRGSLTYVTT